MRSLPNSTRWIGVLVPGRVYRHSIGMTPRKLRIVVMCDRCRRSTPRLADADFPGKYATKSARRKEGESPQCESSIAVLRCTITIFRKRYCAKTGRRDLDRPVTAQKARAEPLMRARFRARSPTTVNVGMGDDRIEQREQDEAGEKAADMRLPRDRLFDAGDRERAQTEQDIDAEPGRQKRDDTHVAQRRRQRRGRAPIGRFIAA